MQDPLQFYDFRANEYTSQAAALEKKIVWVSLARLIAFILILFIVYRLFVGNMDYLPIILVLFIALFIIFLRISFNLVAEKKLAVQLAFINKNELVVLRNGVNAFPDGDNMLDSSVYSEDLDILGPASLYHLLNRTTTSQGANSLCNRLNFPMSDVQAITANQDAIKQMSSQPVIRQMITARGLSVEKQEGSIDEISRWIQAESKLINSKWLKYIKFLLPVFNVAAFVYYLDTNNPIPFGIGIALSWIIISIFAKYIHRQHVMMGRKQSMLIQYASILHEFDRTQAGSSEVLKTLLNISNNGGKEIRQLSWLANMFDQRLNLLVNFLLNSFIVYDIHCMVALEYWKDRNRERFAGWIDAVGEIEMLNSFATFSFNNPAYCYPQAVTGTPMIDSTGLAHPMIPADESVKNDFCAGKTDKFLLVTGSNMSGKSTFLRTVGINMVLAQCGAPVCAQKFEFTPMRILTSIRINDSLQEHTSYFMAELKRLKEIIGSLESGEPSLVLIDEVLRGTNSTDKTHGSHAFIKKLIGYNCLSLFATHDLALSKMEEEFPAVISNYCFESNIISGQLLFDYTLRKGVATNKNATFLMEKMGII